MNTTNLFIDPGCNRSAWLIYDGARPLQFDITPNEELLSMIVEARTCGDPHWSSAEALVIEQVASMGMSVGAEVFETVFWSGRFCQAWRGPWDRVKRMAVKMHLCGNSRAKDPNIRQALIDRFGGDSVAIGGARCKRCHGKGWTGRDHAPCVCEGGYITPPGPLHCVTADCWAALAVAVTWTDQHRAPARSGSWRRAIGCNPVPPGTPSPEDRIRQLRGIL